MFTSAGDSVQVVYNGRDTTGSVDYFLPKALNNFVGFRV